MLNPTHGLYGTERKGLNHTIGTALKLTFENIDEDFYKKKEEVAGKCGTTAVVVIILGKHIFCANIGDSRAILSHRGKAINLSLDHKASRPDEVIRIELNNGLV